MNNECIPLREAAYTQRLTVHCTAAVTGKRFVAPLGARQSGGLAGLAADPLAANDGSDYVVAGPPAAGGAVGGVAAWDAGIAAKCPIIRGAGTIVPVTSAAAISVGQTLKVDATGAVLPVTTGTSPVGVAHSAAGAGGVDVEVELLPTPYPAIAP